jgi:hypothetical protein
MIDPNEFDETLRRLTRSATFTPFEVEMDDGRKLVIRHPGVAFGGGGAAFLDPDEGIVDFTHDHVVGFRAAGQEIGA